jgi:hypothetical protein
MQDQTFLELFLIRAFLAFKVVIIGVLLRFPDPQ